jgi:tetratricopeptide (TPR) repeat protein
MALKNSKFSHLTRTLNSIPLAGKDGLTTPQHEPEVKPIDPEAQAKQPQVTDADLKSKDREPPPWQAKLHSAKTYFKKNGERIGLAVCAVSAVLLIGAVLFSTMSARHLKRGEQLSQAGNYTQALPELNSALWFNPNSVAALYERAQIYARGNDFKGAIDDYSRAIKINPFYKDVLERRANAYLNIGDSRSAISDYGAAISLTNTPRASLYGDRAQAYANIGDFNAAIADYDVAIEHAPKNASLYLGRCQCFIRSEQYKKGLKDCEVAAELEPRNAKVYMKRAWCEHFLGQHAQAMKDLDLSQEINPEISDSYYYRGTFLLLAGQYDQALAEFEKAIRLNDKDPRYYLLKGETYNQLGDKRKAIPELEKALKIPPIKIGDVQPVFIANLLAQIYAELGDYRNAVKKLTFVIDANPQKADSYARRAKYNMKAGNYLAAVSDCDSAIAMKQDGPEYYCTRAICQARLGRQVSAEQDFDKALSLAPRSFDMNMAKGNFYLERKNFDKAADSFAQAAHINPNSQIAKSKLALLFSILKRGSYTPVRVSANTRPGKELTDNDSAPLSSNLNVLLESGYKDLAKGRAQRSIEELSRAVQLYPNDPRARRYLAYALLEARQPLGALEQFKHLATLGQQTVDDQMMMADAFRESGRPKEAIRICKRCLDIDESNVKAYAKMARAYAALGFPEKAIEVCQTGMKVASTAEQQEELEAVRAQISSPQPEVINAPAPTHAPKLPPGGLGGGGG